MTENPLRQLHNCGQSVWNDFIRRTFVTNGDLQRLVDEDGLGGITSNPTIFEKAIGGSSDYDDQLKALVAEGLTTEQIFQRLASTDVQMAADVLRPVYDRLEGYDGYVSIEVSPSAAHDTEKTLTDAHVLRELVDRPNVMIKVPATPEGIPAIEHLIAEGINVNITLIFAVEVYEAVMEAYLRGLERRADENQPIDRIASVASFFVSRVDTLVDARLEERIKAGEDREELEGLRGKAAIANAKIAYERFQAVFGSERFARLQQHGARVQRPLWASTSTKDPRYPDTMYVDTLIGPDTVNTMPPQTIVAVRDHGVVRCGTVTEDVPEAHRWIQRLGNAGVNMTDITTELTVDGVKKFMDSLDSLYATIEEKSAVILAGVVGGNAANLDGHQEELSSSFQKMTEDGFLTRLWKKDPGLWKSNPSEQNEITNRLGWLRVSDAMMEQMHFFEEAARYVQEQRFTHAVVLGMGGSSLAPYVLAQSFGAQAGFPRLLVLDSTDPDAVRQVEETIDLGRTLFLVSTKSGGTTETMSFFHTFWHKVHTIKGESTGDQFFAITDPGTSLEALAKEHAFHSTFLNPADIGGRYSALSFFGLIPAAVAGLDVRQLLTRAVRMERACSPSVPPPDHPGSWLGAIMAHLAAHGRNKVTFFLSPEIESLGLWLEQLIAESTGKEGKGLVPVPDNPPGSPEVYGDDHLFVYVRLASSTDVTVDGAVERLRVAGQPVVYVDLEDLFDLGAEFVRWEFATAVAGALLGINAFDQPNVQESKDNTQRVLTQYEQQGTLSELTPIASENGVSVFANRSARGALPETSSSIESTLAHFLARASAPSYLALMAYLAPSPENDAELATLRTVLRDARAVATTVGYGPRFLHSTGQLHKGGPPQGLFLQITVTADADEAIPGAPFTYQTLIHAQAEGDFQSLDQHGRPALRIHLPSESPDNLREVTNLLRKALRSPSPAARR